MAGEQSSNILNSVERDDSNHETSTGRSTDAANLTHDRTSSHSSTHGGSRVTSASASTVPPQSANNVANKPPNAASTSARNSAVTMAGEAVNRQQDGRARATSIMRVDLNSRETQAQVKDAVSAAYLSGVLIDSDLRLEEDSSDDDGGS